MTSATTSKPFYFFDTADTEIFARFTTSIILQPITSLACYILPFLGATLAGYIKLQKNDDSQREFIADDVKDRLYKLVNDLKQQADMPFAVDLYKGSISSFDNIGGGLSLTAPFIAVSEQCINRPDNTHFGEPVKEPEGWCISDEETQFYIARELGYIKHNQTLIRVLIKTSMVAVTFFLYLNPFGYFTAAVALSAIGFYILIERHYQGKMDLTGIEILGKYLGNTKQAAEIALHALQKKLNHNITRLENVSLFASYTLQKNGNNRLDAVAFPSLTSRIAQIQQLYNIHLSYIELQQFA